MPRVAPAPHDSPRATILAICVGGARTLERDGKPVATGIFKQPVTGRVRVGPLGLEGDVQADRRVHGGLGQAVYAYPAEHYAFWREELPRVELPRGMFGENLTIEGMLEGDVRVGDRFRAGTAELIVTKPRFPCFKLGLKFGRADMIARFLASGRSGFYFSVPAPGTIGAGDILERVASSPDGPTIASLVARRLNRAPV